MTLQEAVMDWKTPAVLSLLFLGAAAAPPGGCLSGAGSGEAMPVPLDLAGRPYAPSGLAGPTFATQPGSDGDDGCLSPPASTSLSTTLRSESSDVLHGLPMPDSLRPIDEPKRAPEFQ
jgi:hypothetical protein